jgi:hypothetical protein
LRVKTFPARERIATATATAVPTRAMPTAACEYTSTHRAAAPITRAGAPSTGGAAGSTMVLTGGVPR